MARNRVPVVLANSKTASAVAQGSGLTPVGIYIPKAFSGTTLKFQSYTPDGNTCGPVSDGAGSDYTLTVRAGDYVRLSRDVFFGIDGLQIISGTSQSGDCTLIVVFN